MLRIQIPHSGSIASTKGINWPAMRSWSDKQEVTDGGSSQADMGSG